MMPLKASEEYQQYDDQSCSGSVRTNWACACLGGKKKRSLCVQKIMAEKQGLSLGADFCSLVTVSCFAVREAATCLPPVVLVQSARFILSLLHISYCHAGMGPVHVVLFKAFDNSHFLLSNSHFLSQVWFGLVQGVPD